MIYGLRSHDFIENGPAATAIEARAVHSTRSWRVLSANRRLDLVERAMTAANDAQIDDFPIAL